MDTREQLNMLGDMTPERTSVLPIHLNYNMEDSGMQEIPDICGMYYMPGFLEHTDELELIDRINAGQWRHDLERRVQHYGWIYDYQTRTITSEMKLGALPVWVGSIAKRLFLETNVFSRVPDQAIVNEYFPGQGIALHADRQCFGSAVATISLGDDWEMRFRPVKGTRNQDRRIMLLRGSALIMTGHSRFDWMHGIDKRKTERGAIGQRSRKRRLSVTFRTVLTQSVRSTSMVENRPW